MSKDSKINIQVNIKGCEYIDDFIEALANVEYEYYIINICNEGKKKEEKYMERVFAYELYHQYRKIMERKPEVYCKEDVQLYLCGEQTKLDKVCEGLHRSVPDLVLHGSFSSCYEQRWICEIKTFKNGASLSDLGKLAKRLAPLKFKNSIFLCIGTTKETFVRENSRKLKNKDKNIICILSYRTDKELEIYASRLEDMLD